MATDPIYRQIADDLRRKIENGEFAADFRRLVADGEETGDPSEPRLPTEGQLMEQYGASRNTVRDAIKVLTTRRLVETRPGRGTFIVRKITPLVIRLSDPDTGGSGEVDVLQAAGMERRQASASSVRIEVHEGEDAPKTISALKLGAHEPVISRHQKRYLDGMSWSMQTSFYPMSVVEDGATRLLQARNIDEGTMAYLKEARGIVQAGWRDTLTVRAPDNEETAFFKLPADGRIAVIETTRTAYGQDGKPVRTTVTVYPADRNQFVAYFGVVPTAVMDTGD
jgi:GntR family transcriptional regulator